MANNAIIQAAGIANAPKQPDGLLSGFVQGIGELMTGLVTREAQAKKRAAVVDKAYTGKTDIESVADIVYNTKEKVKNGDLTMDQGIKALESFSYDVNTYLPKINKLMSQFSADGFSQGANNTLTNFITSATLGELKAPVVVNGVEVDTFIQSDASGNLTMTNQEGKQVPFSEVLSELESMVKKTDGDKAASAVTSFSTSKFTYGDNSKYDEASDLMLTTINKEMKDPNAKTSLLFDNAYIIKGKNYQWTDYYMKTSMSDDEYKTIKKELDKTNDPIVRERTKSVLVQEVMKGDKNVNDDINSFFSKIIKLKKPGKPNVEERNYEYMSSNVNTTNYTQTQMKQLRVASQIERMAFKIADIDLSDPKALTVFNLQYSKGIDVELVPDGNNPGQVYFRKKQYGSDKAEQPVSYPFKGGDANMINNIIHDVFMKAEGGPTIKGVVYEDYFNNNNIQNI